MKKKNILIFVIIFLVILFVVLKVKDIIISQKLTSITGITIEIKNLGFDLLQVFSNDPKSFSLSHLSVGEDKTKVNMEDIKFEKLRKNEESPDYCLDGHAKFGKFNMGHLAHNSCSGGIDFYCLPYAADETKHLNLLLENGHFDLGDSTLLANGSVKWFENNGVHTNFSGSLSRGVLSETLKCLNSNTDEIKAKLEIPNFSLHVISAKDIDSSKNFTANGDFNLYQGRFQSLDIIKPVFRQFKLAKDLEQKDTKKFNKISGLFSVENEVVNFSNLYMDGGLYGANGKGKIDFNGDIDFKLNIKGVESLIPAKALRIDALLPKGLIPILITGTTEEPKVKLNPLGLINTISAPVITDSLRATDKALGATLNKIFNGSLFTDSN